MIKTDIPWRIIEFGEDIDAFFSSKCVCYVDNECNYVHNERRNETLSHRPLDLCHTSLSTQVYLSLIHRLFHANLHRLFHAPLHRLLPAPLHKIFLAPLHTKDLQRLVPPHSTAQQQFLHKNQQQIFLYTLTNRFMITQYEKKCKTTQQLYVLYQI